MTAMSYVPRGIGGFGPVRDAVPEWLAVLFALLTQLGDVWFVAALLVTAYWFYDGDETAVAIGMATGGLALLLALKHFFALPRPAEPLMPVEALPQLVQPLYAATATAEGYGFPSGHALLTTVAYFSLADVLSVGTRRRRYAGAAAIVTVVCLSRVVLGVHFLVDVVAGVALGAAFLLTVRLALARSPVDRPSSTFAIAVVLAALNLAVSGTLPDAVLLFGASLGAFGGWQLVELGRVVAARRSSTAARTIAVRGGLAAVALVPLIAALASFALSPSTAVGGGVGLAVAAVVAAPVVARSVRVRRYLDAVRS